MEEFMQAFEENKAKEMDNLGRIESEILNCMEKISRNVHLAATLPEWAIIGYFPFLSNLPCFYLYTAKLYVIHFPGLDKLLWN